MAEKRTKAELLAALEKMEQQNAANAARLSNAEIAYRSLKKQYDTTSARLNNAKTAYRNLQKQYEDLTTQLKDRSVNRYITIWKTTYDYDSESGQTEKDEEELLSGKGYVDWVSKTLYVSKDFTRSDGSHGSEVKKYVFETCFKGKEENNFYGEIRKMVYEGAGTTIYINYSVAPIRKYDKKNKKDKDNK